MIPGLDKLTDETSPTVFNPWSDEDYFYLNGGPYLATAHNFVQTERASKHVGKSKYFTELWQEWFAKREAWKPLDFPHRRHRRLACRKMKEILDFDPLVDVNRLRYEWMQLSRKDRKIHWPGLILNILAKHPQKALKFLLATCVSPLPHAKHISDVLDFIVDHYLYRRNDSPITSEEFAVLFGVIKGLLQEHSWSELAISEYSVIQLSRHADRIQTQELYQSLAARGEHLSLGCRLNLIEDLARRGATDTAVEVLETLHQDGVDFTRPFVESVCATLLRCSQRDPDAKLHESDIFALLLQYGLRPKINFYNILAHNAIESGDHETAWKVYDMLVENGIEPSEYTYSIFLNDAKWRLDVEALDDIIKTIRSKDIRNEYIATDMLHAMWMMHDSKSKGIDASESGSAWESLWRRMLSIYDTYFERGPLEDFAPEYFTFSTSTSDESRKMHPDTPTLNFMIMAALKCAVKQPELPQLYERYRRFVQDGHPDFVKVADESIVSTAFIMRMGQHPRTLPFCTKVLADMLGTQSSGSAQVGPQSQTLTTTETPRESIDRSKAASSSSNAPSPDKLSERPRQPSTSPKTVPFKPLRPEVSPVQPSLSSIQRPSMAPPTVHTWTALLSAFMTQKQPRAAEKILKMMTSRGVQPNRVTWNTLILGYAQMEDIAGTGDSIARAQRTGWPINADLLGRLGPMREHAVVKQGSVGRREEVVEEEEEGAREAMGEQAEGVGDGEARVSRRRLRGEEYRIDEARLVMYQQEARREGDEAESERGEAEGRQQCEAAAIH